MCPHKTGTQCKCWPCLLADHPAGCLNEISLQGMSSMGAECDAAWFFQLGKGGISSLSPFCLGPGNQAADLMMMMYFQKCS